MDVPKIRNLCMAMNLKMLCLKMKFFNQVEKMLGNGRLLARG